MEEIRAGSRGAFRSLFNRYWAPLLKYATGIVGPDAAEDAVQEAFVRIWKHRDVWTSRGSAGGYLYRITRNAALDARRRARNVPNAARDLPLHVLPASPPTPHDDFVSRRLQAEVAAAVGSLPERRREVFVLARVHGLSHAEIAESMEISAQTVANHMSAALQELREKLSGLLPPS